MSNAPPPFQPHNQNNNPQPTHSAEKYPTQVETTYVPPASLNAAQQTQYQQPPPQHQYPSEIRPTAAGVAFAPTGEQGYQSQAAQQYQQSQRQPVVQPPYGIYQPPQSAGAGQQQPIPAQQSTYYSAPAGAPNLQPDAHRDSSVSSVSSPGSPAPPYVNMTPAVPEMLGEGNHHTYGTSGRNEMPAWE